MKQSILRISKKRGERKIKHKNQNSSAKTKKISNTWSHSLVNWIEKTNKRVTQFFFLKLIAWNHFQYEWGQLC